jgi:hypothetical protein
MAKYQATIKNFGYQEQLWYPGQKVVVPPGSPLPPARLFVLIEADPEAEVAKPAEPVQVVFADPATPVAASPQIEAEVKPKKAKATKNKKGGA